MRSYILSYAIENEINYKLRKIVGQIGRVFQGQDIPVSWFKPEQYMFEIMNFGYSLPFLKKYFLLKKLDSIVFKNIDVALNRCEIGTSRKYKDLVYISIDKGGDSLRDFVFNIRRELKIDDFSNYIPRISLARVTKDLTIQEYTNLKTDLYQISEEIGLKNITFTLKALNFYEVDKDQLKVIKNFSTSKLASS